MNIKIKKELKDKNPDMALGTIICKVSNTKYNADLWKEIKQICNEIRNKYSLDTIKTNKQITATRNMYLACGKKPCRYRPAAEALMRRIIKDDNLYQINTLVDLINLLSLKTGYSVGAFDADLIEGNITAGIGKINEPYEGIGRGQINIHQLPVLRDNKGAIGTPTSDEIRTAISLNTVNMFVNINGYTGKNDLTPALDYAEKLLIKYADAKNIIRQII
jgi:DNA/RNA-binding domain of Phe-tRNA-synthetase-like protein